MRVWPRKTLSCRPYPLRLQTRIGRLFPRRTESILPLSRNENYSRNNTSRDRRREKSPHSRPDTAPEWFACVHCGTPVTPEAYGTAHRNHCPHCLWSKHLDEEPGDRASECRSSMEPIAVWARPGGDWAIIHRCRGCGILHSNRIAGDDNELLLVALAVRALSAPPFPLSRLTQAVGDGSIPLSADAP